MPIFIVTTAILGSALVTLALLSQAALWQRKEYRWDRFLAQLLGHDLRLTHNRLFLLAIIIIGNSAWLAAIAENYLIAERLGWIILLSITGYFGYRFMRRGIYRPDVTHKAILLVAITTGLTTIYLRFIFAPDVLPVLQWATLVLLIPLLTALAVPVTNLPTSLRKKRIIQQARALRQSLPELAVVGITGSYGKTSTKHFLAQILNETDQVFAVTAEHRNAEFPVAQDMLKQLNPKTSIYVVEMGAYRAGEIAALTRLARPSIGAVTAIGNQHLALFGSRQRLAAAKWELIQSLPPNGVAVLNADSSTVVQQAKDVTQKIIWYSQQQPADVYASDIAITPTEITATIHLRDQNQRLTLPLLGTGLLSSTLAAAATALALKVASNLIFKALPQLTPPPRTMELVPGYRGATIINDSYSANERGVINALEQLNRFPNQSKIVVLAPLIELGLAGPAVHQRLSQALADTNAQVFITDHTFTAELTKHLPKKNITIISDPKQLLTAIKAAVSHNAIVLLEGRIPDVVRKGLTSKT